MIRTVHLDANLNKQLKALHRAGGSAGQAAGHAERIIADFLNGAAGVCTTGRLTKNGEARIRNSVKYDLVHGYRLIAVKREETIVFVYVGNHDDCDHWIRNNIGLTPIAGKRRNEAFAISKAVCDGEPSPQSDQSEIDYDELLLKSINERDLRIIFRGICGG